MSAEEEKRLHRCCFSGHRPEKLNESPEEVKAWLSKQIDEAISDGYCTFISGCGMGVDIWAGQIVLQKKAVNPSLHLIAAIPWPGFSNRWSMYWQRQYTDLLQGADLVFPVSKTYHIDVFKQRNEWLVNHSSRLIAYYNGAPGGTQNTIDYAQQNSISVVTNNPYYDSTPSRKKEIKDKALKGKPSYPQNLIMDIGIEHVFQKEGDRELNEEQYKGLEHALSTLTEREQSVINLRYREKVSLQAVSETFVLSQERIRQIQMRALRKLMHPSRLMFYRDGLEAAMLQLKLQCAEELKRCLQEHLLSHPQATEEDVVKFVFQGMLGVGHLVESSKSVLGWLETEMNNNPADEKEPLLEKLSTWWVRLNLRAARARGFKPDEIAYMVYCSSKQQTISFTRQNVYNFCMKLNAIDRIKMHTVAIKILDDHWLPSHSESYRTAYHPAYRVLHRDFKKFRIVSEIKEDNENEVNS